MSRSKIIRGKPIYVYRGSQYFDMPPKTVIKRIEYDKATGRSTVYCTKRLYVVEAVSIIIILLCVLINLFYAHHIKYTIRYNSVSSYYDGRLYLNVYNDDENPFDLKVSLLDFGEVVYTDTLSPGEYLIYVDIENVSDKYSLRFEYRTMFSDRTEEVQINVSRKED